MTLSLACAGTVFARQPTSPEHTQFSSGNVPVRVEWFRTQHAGAQPAVLIVHGADGLRQAPEVYPRFASLLASRGFHVMIVHYFDRTQTRTADLPTMIQNFDTWTSTVSDALHWAARQPGVDADRIGLLGVSLGSAIALTLGTREPGVKCIVEFFGVLPDTSATAAGRVPPTLVLHGDQDPVVPVSAAYQIEQFLTRCEADFEVKIYAGQGHGFYGQAQIDAESRTLNFFAKHLNGAAI